MDYRFNYAMLQDWMDANPGQTKRSLARSLGYQDYQSISRWIDGKRAIPIEHMLRFCNLYQIPLEKFFFDNDATPVLNLKHAGINDQTEPTGGFVKMNSNGGPHYPSPVVTEHLKCVVPGKPAEKPEHETLTAETEGTATAPTADITQIFLSYQQAVERMQKEHYKREDEIRNSYEHKWDKEREGLLYTIRALRDELEQARHGGSYGMVAEELTVDS